MANISCMGSRPLKADAELLKTTIFIGFGTQGKFESCHSDQLKPL